ncbi:MAG: alpha/beta hydrolase [Desulfobacterales bacterium]|nr:alpha/beta hydrolase [Desulfobacterales bacterium]
MHPALRISLGLASIYLVYCALLFVFQRQMIFPRYMAATLANMPEEFPQLESIWLDLPGMRVESWFLPPHAQNLPAPAIILTHGNAETIDFLPEEFHQFTTRGVALMMVEFPGYGRSEGAPSQPTITAAMLKAHDILAARPDVDANRIILMGRSLGAGATCQLAARRPSRGLVLVSPFTRITAFAPRYLVPPFLVKDPFDNLAVIRAYRQPVLIMHGARDEVIPYRHGQTLAATAFNGKLVTFESGHNDLPTGSHRFWEAIDAFFQQIELFPKEPAAN